MKPLIIVIFLILSITSFAQEEGYATVSAINNNILILNNCKDEYGDFKVNQKVVVIQRENPNQVIQASSNNNQVAKKYIVLTITEVERSADNVVTSIRVSKDLQNSFVVNNFSGVDVRIIASRKWNW